MTLPVTNLGTSGTALTTPTCVSAWIEYPFKSEDDQTTKIYHHLMQVKALNYTPLANDDEMTTAGEKPSRSPFSDDSSAYWVGDSAVEPIDGGMVQFTRLFANIPQNRSAGAGPYSFVFPGNNNTTYISDFNQSGVSFATVNGRPEVTFTATSADSAILGTGDRFTLAAGAASIRQNIQAKPYGSINQSLYCSWVVFAKSGNIIKGYLYGYEGIDVSTIIYTAFTYFQVEKITVEGRDGPKPANSTSILRYRYIKTNDINSEKLGRKFSVMAGASGVADPSIVEDINSATIPNTSHYGGMAHVGSYIAAEPEMPRRWMGNIWEIISREVVAI